MNGPSIRIVSTPPGDAPLWVREKWVGLQLPIMGNDMVQSSGVSVNVKPTVLHHLWARICGRSETITGYRVEAKHAVDILAAVLKQQNGGNKIPPDLLRSGRRFVFHVEACRLERD